MRKKVRGATISFTACQTLLADIPLSELKENDDYVNERHWRDGQGWIGWKPVADEKGSMSEAAQRQWQHVCQSFTQKNVIGSNIKRVIGAIFGNEPNFNIVSANTPTIENDSATGEKILTSEDKFFAEIDDQIVTWWTQNEIHQVFKDLVKAKATFGKTAILVYVPNGYLEEKEITVTEKDKTETRTVLAFDDTSLKFEEVLERIKVDVIHYTNMIDVRDPDFGTKYTIVKLAPTVDGKERIGVFYVDTDKQSYFRVVFADDTESTASCNLSGNNLCLVTGRYEDSLVTRSVKTLQDGVNHAETGVPFALANINYPETTFINAADLTDDDGKRTTPKQGLGIFRQLRGLIQEGINGVTYTTPTVHERQGADPEKFDKVSEKKSRDIDMLMQMGFKHLADSEYASGDSKAKSMDDTDILMNDIESTFNTIGTKVLENVIRLAFHFTKQSNKNKDFNVLFRVNMSHGKLTNEDKAGMREEVSMGLRSDENYMLTTKVSDNPKLEQQRIAAQPPKLLPQSPATKPPTVPNPANAGK